MEMETLLLKESTAWEESENRDLLSKGYEHADTLSLHMDVPATDEHMDVDDSFHARLSYMSIFNIEDSENVVGTDDQRSKKGEQTKHKQEHRTESAGSRSEIEDAATVESNRLELMRTIVENCQTYVELASINETFLSTITEHYPKDTTGSEFISQVTNQSLATYLRKLFLWKDTADYMSEYPTKTIAREYMLKSHLIQLEKEYNELMDMLKFNLRNKECKSLALDSECRQKNRQIHMTQLMTSCINQGTLGSSLARCKALFNSLYAELTKAPEGEALTSKSFAEVMPHGYHRFTIETSLRLNKYRLFKEKCVLDPIIKAQKKSCRDEIKTVKEKMSNVQRKIAKIDKKIVSKDNYRLQMKMYPKLKNTFDNELRESEEMICRLLKSYNE